MVGLRFNSKVRYAIRFGMNQVLLFQLKRTIYNDGFRKEKEKSDQQFIIDRVLALIIRLRACKFFTSKRNIM